MDAEAHTSQTSEQTISETEERVYHPPPGDWLFKLRDEIYGPVTAKEIVDRMFSGEVVETTEVSQEEGEWRLIEDIDGFRPFLIKAKATRQAHEARLKVERDLRRRRRRVMLKMMSMSFFVLMLGFGASYYLIAYRSDFSNSRLKKWAGKHLPLLQIQSKVAFEIKHPQSGPDGKKIEIDQILIDDAPALVDIHSDISSTDRVTSDKGKKSVRQPASSGQLSNEEITSVVYNRRNLQRFYSCIRSVMRTNPDLPSEITIEFSISNDGRAGQLRMDDIRLDNGPLHQCLSKKIAALRFRPYRGQVRNVTIPFNLKKR